ncbi:hypothetical protein Rhe02_72250 [Rhizocola hellebori]|uniref:Mycothiol-dependent maleylpyruvate isomerase metal-binding domain-containing protein n=1 Tax=Rhizocola hellebori TaxID=1392758 RepID=A0A8J3QGT6_9ACTN|nr:maleylpyruvate isomerase family mycothiol-dependent enzyme [Rhizocola hellebori]GIH09158.1 hypothetical protein Rhe02_72250 [Rhizocola hellebori]
MTATADANIAALRSGFDQLATFVRGLSDEQLTGPSGASEWDISQVLSHLGSGSVINLAVLEAALAGNPNPGNDFNKQVWARWDAMAPAERAQGFLEHNEILTTRYESLDPDTRANLLVDMGFLPAPVDVATVTSFRLSEFTLHSWDVRVGLDPSATLLPQATTLLVESSLSRLGWLAKPEALQGKQSTLRLQTSEPDLTMALHLGDQVTVSPGAPERSDGVLTLPAESLLRLISGRLSAERTPSSVVLDGGPVDLADLRRVFPGF